MPSDPLLTKSMMEMDLGREATANDMRGRKSSKKKHVDDRYNNHHHHQDRVAYEGRGHRRHFSHDSGAGETRSTSRMTGASTAYDYCDATSPSRSAQAHSYSTSHPTSARSSGVPRHIIGGGRRSAAADDGYRDPPPLSWRLDPDESLSDWTLTVASTDSVPCIPRRRNETARASGAGCSSDNNIEAADNQSDGLADSMSPPAKKYHVHRAQLAVGLRRSDYFATLFKNRRRMMRDESDRKHEKGTDASTDGTYIELKASAAAAFPIMLDFMYSPIGTPVEATTESAVALRHLASCFGIRELFNCVTDFIKSDLRSETAPTYLLEAATYKHEKLIAASLKICAESFMDIKLSEIVLIPPDLFELVVRSPHLVCNSEALSVKVAAYCRCRPDGIDLETIKSLTDAQIMPRIAPDEALFYIHMLSLLGVDLPDPSKGGAAPTLYDRCVMASPNVIRGALQVKHSPLCTHTSNFHDRHRQTINKDYDDLPTGVKVDLLESTIADTVHTAENSRLHEEKESDKEEITIIQTPSSDELRDELSAAKEAMMDLQGEIKRLKRKMERTIEKYETKLNAREDEVQKCKEELSRFVRVPNDNGVPSACTYQEYVEYDKYGEPIFGQIPPTAMPRWGQAERDGLIYREEERFDTRYWPMFYYKGDK